MSNILELENKVAQLEKEVECHKALIEKQKLLYQTGVELLEEFAKSFCLYSEDIKSKIDILKT